MNEDVLDIFYNSIIPEASTGSVDCFMYYNICFNTIIEGHMIKKDNPFYIDAPVLEIKNKSVFDELLKKYVELALEFYDDSFYYDEVLSGEYRTNENKICKEKVIMTLLWSNATTEDFQNACQFIRRQIAYLQTNPLTSLENIGFSEILAGNIKTQVTKTRKMSWESPYAFYSFVTNEEETHDLPFINFGIHDNTVYIYSIHNSKNSRKSKKINRNLYKVNENFNPEVNNVFLKDITPSSLVALDLFLLHFTNLGYTNFKVVPYLPERWNDKIIMIQKKAKKENKKIDDCKDKFEEIISIQNNLTQKFITTFLRLNYHYDSDMIIKSYPWEQDSYLSFTSNGLSNANNTLFKELSSLYLKKNKTR